MAAPVADAAPVVRPNPRRTWRRDAALLALGAIVLRLPALLASRHLTFDDGQYGTVVLGLRAGDLPFRDLFSSQGPLFYPLLWVADLAGLRTLDGPRLLDVVSGVGAAVATYAVARRVTSRSGALLAGVLVATAGSILYVTAPLAGDGPALALAIGAVALALGYRANPSRGRAVAIGVAMGAAVCVKLIVAPAAIPIGLLLLGFGRGRGAEPDHGRRSWSDIAAAVGASIVVLIVTVVPWGPSRVWDQSVAYHRGSERLHSYTGNGWLIVRTLVERDPFVVAAAVASIAFMLVAARHDRASVSTSATSPALGRSTTVDTRTALVLFGLWFGAQALFLVIEPTMFRPHVSQVVAPLALLACLRAAPWRVVAVLCVLLVPWWVNNVHDILWPSAYGHNEQAVVNQFRALPADQLVISDEPGFAWRADRRVPPNFVDVSMKRFQDGRLNTSVVATAAVDPRVCAVLVWSNTRLGSLRALPRRLVDEGYEVTARYGGPKVLYERPDCKP